MKRRNRITIIVDILDAASEGASRTRIMYLANLNFSRFERYFGELLDKGLIEQENSTTARGWPIFKTTEKARAILEQLKKLDEYTDLLNKK